MCARTAGRRTAGSGLSKGTHGSLRRSGSGPVCRCTVSRPSVGRQPTIRGWVADTLSQCCASKCSATWPSSWTVSRSTRPRAGGRASCGLAGAQPRHPRPLGACRALLARRARLERARQPPHGPARPAARSRGRLRSISRPPAIASSSVETSGWTQPSSGASCRTTSSRRRWRCAAASRCRARRGLGDRRARGASARARRLYSSGWPTRLRRPATRRRPPLSRELRPSRPAVRGRDSRADAAPGRGRRPPGGAAAYEQLADGLRRELWIAPSSVTRDLAESLRTSEEPAAAGSPAHFPRRCAAASACARGPGSRARAARGRSSSALSPGTCA